MYFITRKVSHMSEFPFVSFQVSYIQLRDGAVENLNENDRSVSMIYIASGEGQLLRKGKQTLLKEGKSYWVTETSILTSASAKFLSVYMLSWIKEGEERNSLLSTSLADHQPSTIVPLWEEVLGLQSGQSISEQCRFQARVWDLLTALTDHREEDRIGKAIELLRNSLTLPYSITELAEKANMTPNSFSRSFRKRVGMSPKQFLNEERMKAAKELMLQHKGITTKDVAYQIGLHDEFYFSRLFKSKEGVAPSIYMKRCKERVAVVSQLFLQDHLLSLGVQPVAAPSYPSVYPTYRGIPTYLEKELEGTVLLNAEEGFRPEEILKTQPDMIIKTPLHHGKMPSILLAQQQRVHHIPFQTKWNDYLRRMASILGQESKVDRVEREIFNLECKVKDEMCPLTKKGNWAVIWIRREEIRLYGRSHHAFSDLLFQTLGFEPHPHLPAEGYQMVSMEQLAELNADKLLILWSHEADVWKVASTQGWKKINAVKKGEVYYPDSHEWDAWGPLGRKNMLLHFTSAMHRAKINFQ
jgi:AraC family transcriptional regulator, transcriptional activator for feuABC-ybbA operon